MRKALGIDSETDDSLADAPFCGEALISGTTISKGDVAQTARAWMTKSKATGAVAELAADGTTAVEWFREGAAVKDAKETGLGSADQSALQDAAKEIPAAESISGLGSGRLACPGEWQPGSHSGESSVGAEDHKAKEAPPCERRFGQGWRAKSAKPAKRSYNCVGEMSLRYKGPLNENNGGIVSLGFIPSAPDPVWAREFRNDLKGQSLIYLYGDVWMHGGEIRGYTCSALDVALLSQVLGDPPSGTVIVVGLARIFWVPAHLVMAIRERSD